MLAAAIMLILLHHGVLGEESSSERRKLLDIQSELAEQKQKLKQTRAEEQRALSGLYIIKKNLSLAQKSLSEAKSRTSYNQRKITELAKEYREAEDQIARKSSGLKQRIREIYKSGSGGLLDIIFASKSMSDFINRAYYFERIIDHDAQLIDNIRQQVDTIKRTRVQLKSANEEIKDAVKVIEAGKREITRSSAEKERLYQYLRSRRRDYEKRVKQLEASSVEIERFIKSRNVSQAVSTGRFSWPIKGRITSRFGYRRHPLFGGLSLHTGLDIAASYGKPIFSADGGEVIFSGWWGGYGKVVVMDHGKGYTTVYGHMSRIYMQTGQRVDKAQPIGLVGSTGFSTGPHLHFEVRYNGKPVDPLAYL